MNPRLDEVCRAVRAEFPAPATKDRWWLEAEPVRGGIRVRLRGRLGETEFIVRDGECPRDRANLERRRLHEQAA